MAADEKALINVLLIDAPGDFDEVWLEILGVEILPAGTRGLDNAEWSYIPYTPSNKMVKVSDLVGSQRLLLGRQEIRAGQVSRIRLLLGDTHYLIKDGQQIMLQPAPNADERLTVEMDLQASAGFAWDIYLDINLAKSIQQNTSGGFTLAPSLRAFSMENRSELRGTIQPAEATPHIFAFTETDTIATLSAKNGEFRLRGLTSGTYRIHIQPQATHLDTLFSILVAPDSVYTLGNFRLSPSPIPTP